MRFIFFLILIMLSHDSFANIRLVTIKEIEYSLKDVGPMNVGFDIDDTVLFSSPGFYHNTHSLCDGNEEECLQRSDFWYNINNCADKYSLPKVIGFKLIQLHKTRGDKIYFITARHNSDEEMVTNLLARTFGIQDMQKVIFTGGKKELGDKTSEILRHKIKLFYGDSDGDMDAAKKANIRPIRILRSKNSFNNRPVNIGKFEEEVLLNSEY